MVRYREMMYKEVAHTLLLCGSDIWVVTVAVIKVLEGFHHRAARRITGMTHQRAEDGELEYPPVADAM